MKRLFSLITVLCLTLSLCPLRAGADDALQHDYSTSANSGIRHEVCTTLNGTGADSYYTGSYTYDNLSSMDSSALLQALRSLMTDTHTHFTTYDDCRDLAVITDCENGDGTNISLLYSCYTVTWNEWINNTSGGWNREHVWPKSLGKLGTSGPGADLHHLRPSDQQINGHRGNLPYGYVPGGSTVTGTSVTGNAPGGTRSSQYFEPLDNVKGDVARIILYVYVRYGGDSKYTCTDITKVFQSVDVLLEWCALDPVDTWEMGRNEVVSAIQGNRNVFIDYPELAWLIFGEDIPVDMTTPSGEAANFIPTACAHTTSTVKNASSATCSEDGYSGDTYCASCGEFLSSGLPIAATGHSYGSWTVTKEATATEDGSKERSCTVCGHKQTQTIAATGEEETHPTTAPTEVTQPTEPSTEPSTAPQPTITDPTQTTAGSQPTESSAATVPGVSSGEEDEASFPWPIVIVVLLAGVVVLIVVSKRR